MSVDVESSNVSTMFSRLQMQTSDADNVFNEMNYLSSCSSSQTCTTSRHVGRPLLSTASLADSAFYPQQSSMAHLDGLMSPEPRFHSAPAQMENAYSEFHRQQQQQHATLMRTGSMQPTHSTILGSRLSGPDRRTCSLGDVSTFVASLQQQPAYRKMSDASAWDSTIAETDSQQQLTSAQRYKTELCRPFEEHGTCRYGSKCQFAHGRAELRTVVRHPKYKTEMCRTFHTTGYCPYGPRCHFIHNNDDVDQPRQPHHQQLSRQSSNASASSSSSSAADQRHQGSLVQSAAQFIKLHQHQSRPVIDDQAADADVSVRTNWNPVPSSATQPWPVVSSTTSSVISSAAITHPMPPPGLPVPVGSIGDARAATGCSPTSDLSSTSSFDSGIQLTDSPTASILALIGSHPASSSSLPDRSLPGSSVTMNNLFQKNTNNYPTKTNSFEQPAANATELLSLITAHLRSSAELDADRRLSPVTPDVDSKRRSRMSHPPNFWPTRPIVNSSCDDYQPTVVSSSCLKPDDGIDLQQKMAAMSPDKWRAVIDLIRSLPVSPATGDNNVHLSESVSGLPACPKKIYGRSASTSAYHVTSPDEFRQFVASSPNRAAGVCW